MVFSQNTHRRVFAFTENLSELTWRFCTAHAGTLVGVCAALLLLGLVLGVVLAYTLSYVQRHGRASPAWLRAPSSEDDITAIASRTYS